MRRREVLVLVSASALAWPLVSQAQPASMPVVGLLSSVPFETRRDQLSGFRRGLIETGLVEEQNLRIEYRSADNETERLPALAADLLANGVAVIVTIGGDLPILAAKAATATVPVVFVTGGDPMASGFVASLNSPGGNLTGVSFLPTLLVAKRVELVNELTPAGSTLAVLVNPKNPNAQSIKRDAT